LALRVLVTFPTISRTLSKVDVCALVGDEWQYPTDNWGETPLALRFLPRLCLFFVLILKVGFCALLGGEWLYPTNSLHHFFKVTVEMP